MCYWKTSIDLHSTVVVAQWCFILSEKQSNIFFLHFLFCCPCFLSILLIDNTQGDSKSSWENSLSAPSELNLQQISCTRKSLELQNHGNNTLRNIITGFSVCLPHIRYTEIAGVSSHRKKNKKYSRHTENKQREKEGYRDREANRLALYASQTVGGKGWKFWRIGQPETLLLYFHQFIHIC